MDELDDAADSEAQQTELPDRDELDPAYAFMLDELESEFGDLSQEFENVVVERIRTLYDNREEIKERAAKQQQGVAPER